MNRSKISVTISLYANELFFVVYCRIVFLNVILFEIAKNHKSTTVFTV